MSRVCLEPGICNFSMVIDAKTNDDEEILVDVATACPNLMKAEWPMAAVDPYRECFVKLHETQTYQHLSPLIPHNCCPVYSAILKAIELEAGLALPKDVHMEISR